MYIEFDILTATDSFESLEQAVDNWASQYHVPYTTKIAKNLKYRLGLNYPEHFTLFFVTWTACSYQVKNSKQS